MIIAMDKNTKKSTGSFKLSSLNLKRHRLLKCYLPRDALRHLSDRNTKSGMLTFSKLRIKLEILKKSKPS